MSKNKKGKVVQLKSNPLTPEKYIKTQARSLPIAECMISEEWQDTGMCNVIIARKHKTGNYTVGIYLVDLYCLGLKDTDYDFNIDPEDYEYLKEHSGVLEDCEYVLAHNIIYGAIEFADDFGFQPHKDFAITQFILEEDDENVELMDIEFGFEGQPFYVQGPNDDPNRIKQITSTLMRTAGEGNFKVVEDLDDEEFDGEDFDDEDWYDDDDEDLPGEQEEILEDVLRTLKPVNKVYGKLFRTAEENEIIKKSTIGKGYKLSKNPVKIADNEFDDAEQESHYNQLLELFENSDFQPAIKDLKKAIAQYPGKPQFYNLLQACYIFSEQFDKSDELTVEMYKRFPDYLFAMVPYANMLIDSGKSEQVLKVFNGKPDLNYLYPQRKLFNVHEAAIYYATMCRYFVAEDNIDSAELYINAILKKDIAYVPHQTIVNKALMEFCDAKIKKIKSKMDF
jgi:hypothetical protein